MTKVKYSNVPYAKKSLGQNFLVDEDYIGKIISALGIVPGETVFEIGPGRGALTKHLIESGANVVAIELDRNLVPVLQAEFGHFENFQVIEDDALKIDFTELIKTNGQPTKAKLVANLPYYISTAILQRLMEQRDAFSEFVLMLQKEVVGRITAKVGNSDRGFLTVLVESFCESEKLFDVPGVAFRPVPKVWSSVVKLIPRGENLVENEPLFRQLISSAFTQKRKTILNNLKEVRGLDASRILSESQIDPVRRAETLTLEEWLRLANSIKN